MQMTGQDNPRTVVRWRDLVWLMLVVPVISAASAEAAPPAAGLSAAGAVGPPNYGTIKGRLVWGGDTIPKAKVLQEKGKAEKDPDVCAKDQTILSHELEIDPKTRGVAYGFAYIVKPNGANPEAVQQLIAQQPTAEMDQRNCDFTPHSLAIHQGQTLRMKSSDPKNHNVRLTGFANPGINQNVVPNGSLEVKLVKERFPMEVKCDIHPWMHGHVMVFDHPFFAVTGPDGSFEIKGVPPGDQNLVVWQELVGYVTPGRGIGLPVKVAPGEVTDVGAIKIDPARIDPAKINAAQIK